MNMKQLFIVAVAVIFSLSLGTGFWVYASPGHGGMKDNDHGKQQSRHQTGMSEKGQRSAMGMPMVHGNMSKEEMGQMCERMSRRHASMQSMRQEKTDRLNSLVDSMKQAKGPEKTEAMESVLVELVEQNNHRSQMMMGRMRSMMGSMMAMHQMNPDQRQMMIKQMKDCPMMKGSINGQHGGTPRRSPSQ